MIYVLSDSVSDQFISNGNNFNSNWMSLIQSDMDVKFAPVAMREFDEDNDIIIIYLDGNNPYGEYKLPPNIKKVFIVGRIHKGNANFLNDASYVVYMNDVQQKIAETICGIVKPCIVLPRHPIPVFFDMDLKKIDRVFIGGKFNQGKKTGFHSLLLNLHKKYNTKTNFYIMGADESSLFKEYTDTLTKWLVESPLNKSRIVNLEFNSRYYKSFQLQIAASKYVYLWRDEPTIDSVYDMLDKKDKTILDYPIGDSSILGIAERFGCIIDVEPTISYIRHFKEKSNYNFKDFSNDMTGVLRNMYFCEK